MAGEMSSFDLSRLDLPQAVVEAYRTRGIKSLYNWQAECLTTPGVMEGQNLVYCAPTSGGKTLVSEVLMLQRLFRLRKRAIFVLPYVSVVSEKAAFLQSLCKSTGALIQAFYGGSPTSIKDPFDIAVCTLEKANALINYMVEEGQLTKLLGTLVVDELHLVGDASRGYLLEIFLSKVLFLAPEIQVLGLSATLPNVEDIAKWLNAVLYRTAYRPVPLQEYILSGHELLKPDGSKVRSLSFEGLSPDTDSVVAATWEVTRDGHSVLIFCSSKVKCERTAELLASKLPSSPHQPAEREALVNQMQQQIGGADPALQKTIPAGIAFHHSGLTTEERNVIERGYKNGHINMICATSTLAAGVNLPARRVVFQSPFMGNQLLDSTQYKQMAGRAGRAGQGTMGESIIIAAPNIKNQVMALVQQQLPQVVSCLRNEKRGLKRFILEVLCVVPQLGAGEDLIRFSSSTLLMTQAGSPDESLEPAQRYPEIAEAMKWLLSHDMARLDERSNAYRATPLGHAVCASGLEPPQGQLLFQEMQQARSCISLDTDLHVCYLVTPDSLLTVDWDVYKKALAYLSAAERRVAQRIKLRLDLVDQAQFQGRLPNSTVQSVDGQRIIRFYSALVLWALLHEMPAPLLLKKFALSKGQLQQLQQSAASYTHTVGVFCNRLQWYTLEALILSFQKRLALGVRLELVPLMQIPGMDCSVARALYEQGFTTPVSVAAASRAELLRTLRKTLRHDVPSAALPEENADRLIEAAAGLAKSQINDKRKRARAQNAEQGLTTGPPPKRPSTAATAATSSTRLQPAQVSQRMDTVHPRAMPGAAFSPMTGPSPMVPQVQPQNLGSRPMGHMGRPSGLQWPQNQQQQQQPPPVFASAMAAVPRCEAPVHPSVMTPPPTTRRDTEDIGAASEGDDTEQLCNSVSRCATPCRLGAAVEEETSPLSSERLGEGLRRVGRLSLSPRDVEAVGGSPGAHSCGVASGGASPGGSADSQSALVSARGEPHPCVQSEANFLASALATPGARFRLPPLQILSLADPALQNLSTRLLTVDWIGATIVLGGDKEEALCLSLGPCEAYCLVLPPPTSEKTAAPLTGSIWSWFQDEQNLCLTANAKDLVAAFLKRGIDVQCSLAEPRIAYWLLDPDDKQNVAISNLAALCQINLESAGATIAGNASSLSAVLRARLATSWPEAFVVLPVLAELLRRLGRQQLLGSFWWIEMPIATVLAWMEHFGIGCQTRAPSHTRCHVLYKMAAIQEHVKKVVGRQVLLNSSEDVGRALFEDLRIPLPRGAQMRRKANGRLCYKSPQDLLKRLLPNEVVSLILEYRQLIHAVKRIETIQRSAEAPRMEPLCPLCIGTNGTIGASSSQPCTVCTGYPFSQPRIRTDFVQTGTATGRLATAAGSVPLMCLENAFQISEVVRPSLHEELIKGEVQAAAVAGARVFVAAASEAPPKQRLLREGAVQEVSTRSCDEAMGDGETSLAQYWLSRGWQVYADQARSSKVRQVLIQHGTSVLSYPADQVWRLAAAVDVSKEAAKIMVNPRQLLSAEPGYVLLSLDYSQIEVRLMAHFSGDQRLLDILHQGGDVFKQVAAGWLGKSASDITPEERSGAKRICYSLIYGVGSGKLAPDLGISRHQANELKASFMKEYAGVAFWITSCTDQARQQGFVETVHGRRRFLPGLGSSSAAQRSHAERQAVNTACQASAADLMKAAMIGIHNRLKELRSHASDGQCRLVGRLLLQIHDELMVEVEETRLTEVREVVVSEMIRAGCDLKVPLQVRWKVGKTWGNLES